MQFMQRERKEMSQQGHCFELKARVSNKEDWVPLICRFTMEDIEEARRHVSEEGFETQITEFDYEGKVVDQWSYTVVSALKEK